MIEICKDCNAKNYASEYTNDKQFINCCHGGQFTLPKNPPDPEVLQ